MDGATSRRAVKAAQEVARAASQLASEAAALARIYQSDGEARMAALHASEAAVRAARESFDIEGQERAAEDLASGAIRASLASLEAASAAVVATRAALDAAIAVTARVRDGTLSDG